MSDTQDVPVAIHARNGGDPTRGIVTVRTPAFPSRARSAAMIAGLGLVGGLLFLPVPLIHFFGVALFLAALVVAARRLAATEVVALAHGTCPACDTVGDFFVGTGWKRVRWPLDTSCRHCNMELSLRQAAT